MLEYGVFSIRGHGFSLVFLGNNLGRMMLRLDMPNCTGGSEVIKRDIAVQRLIETLKIGYCEHIE